MADPSIPDALWGQVFSATELRLQQPEWSEAMVEDYLSLLENLVILSDVINQKQDILRTVVNVSAADSPYSISDVDQTLVFDTTLGDIIANLPAGMDGRTYRMTDVGTGGNKVTVVPDGAELLFGAIDERIYNAETLIMTFDTLEGWW